MSCAYDVPSKIGSDCTAQQPLELETAYAETDFVVEGQWPVTLRVEDTQGSQDGWLQAMSAYSAVVVTAWNPFSVATSDAINADANLRLLSAIEQSGL